MTGWFGYVGVDFQKCSVTENKSPLTWIWNGAKIRWSPLDATADYPELELWILSSISEQPMCSYRLFRHVFFQTGDGDVPTVWHMSSNNQRPPSGRAGLMHEGSLGWSFYWAPCFVHLTCLSLRCLVNSDIINLDELFWRWSANRITHIATACGEAKKCETSHVE